MQDSNIRYSGLHSCSSDRPTDSYRNFLQTTFEKTVSYFNLSNAEVEIRNEVESKPDFKRAQFVVRSFCRLRSRMKKPRKRSVRGFTISKLL
jgi:hypothetical protein